MGGRLLSLVLWIQYCVISRSPSSLVWPFQPRQPSTKESRATPFIEPKKEWYEVLTNWSNGPCCCFSAGHDRISGKALWMASHLSRRADFLTEESANQMTTKWRILWMYLWDELRLSANYQQRRLLWNVWYQSSFCSETKKGSSLSRQHQLCESGKHLWVELTQQQNKQSFRFWWKSPKWLDMKIDKIEMLWIISDIFPSPTSKAWAIFQFPQDDENLSIQDNRDIEESQKNNAFSMTLMPRRPSQSRKDKRNMIQIRIIKSQSSDSSAGSDNWYSKWVSFAEYFTANAF
jgi:hypothetical protein